MVSRARLARLVSCRGRYRLAAILALIIGTVAAAGHSPTVYAASAGLKLPFTNAASGWYISNGYNSGDHLTIPGTLYGLDFARKDSSGYIGAAAGMTVVAPASGTIVDHYPCGPAPTFGKGFGIAIQLDGRDVDATHHTYIQICHLAADQTLHHVVQGQSLGKIFDDGTNSHIHMALYTATAPAVGRVPVPFTGDYALESGRYDFPKTTVTDAYACGYFEGACTLVSSQPEPSSTATCSDMSVSGGSGPTATVDNANKVLILASTVDRGCSSLEAQAALAQSHGVDIVNGTQWDALTAATFASYRTLVLGDPVCVDDTTYPIDAANANKTTWGSVLNGNTIIIGTDPVFHSYYGNNSDGAKNVITQGMKFAMAADGKTGAYLDLSCYYDSTSSHTPVPLLDGVNTLPLPAGSPTAFTVQGANCSDSGHLVATDGAVLAGLIDSNLSSWGCSVHEGFDQWPADFKVLALDEESTATYVSPDGTTRGLPYILVRGAGVTSITPLDILPPPGATGSGDTTTDPFVVTLDSLTSAFKILICTLSGGCSTTSASAVTGHHGAMLASPARDGAPAGTIVTLHVGSTTYTAPTDSSGIATFSITPPTDPLTAIYATYLDPVTGNTVTSDTKFYKFTVASSGGGPSGGTDTPELGSGELLLTGLLPIGAALLYRRRARRRAQRKPDQPVA